MEIAYSKHILFHAGLNMMAISVTSFGVCAIYIILLIATVAVDWFDNALMDEQSQINSLVNLGLIHIFDLEERENFLFTLKIMVIVGQL